MMGPGPAGRLGEQSQKEAGREATTSLASAGATSEMSEDVVQDVVDAGHLDLHHCM